MEEEKMDITGKVLIGLNVLVALYWLKIMWRNTPKRVKPKSQEAIQKSYFSRIESARNFYGR